MSGHGDTPPVHPDEPRRTQSVRRMLRRWLETHKPRGSARSQLLLAEMMWTVVGSMLLGVGLIWIVRRYHGPGWAYAAPFLILGLLKALLILDRVARRTINRIRTRGDDHCVGGFFSPTSWALILGMMLLGQVLRASSVPRADVGFLYVAVGSALLISSRMLWKEWLRLRPARARPGPSRRLE
ncbi:MAG: hypothetical protein ACYC6T_11210 [Thermoleophilia bacterium]